RATASATSTSPTALSTANTPSHISRIGGTGPRSGRTGPVDAARGSADPPPGAAVAARGSADPPAGAAVATPAPPDPPAILIRLRFSVSTALALLRPRIVLRAQNRRHEVVRVRDHARREALAEHPIRPGLVADHD